MRREVECEGRILLGKLPPETVARLERIQGSWLEYAPDEGALVVRHVQPSGCQAVSGVPCELITYLDALAPDRREEAPGGTLLIRDPGGRLLRLVVARGEVRIQWAHEDFTHPVSVPVEKALAGIDPVRARVAGFASFGGGSEKAARLEAFVHGFEGLYPEGDLQVETGEGRVRARFLGVNVGPRELLTLLRSLADPPASLEADLEVTSFSAGEVDGDLKIRVQRGEAQAERPSLWREA